MWTGINCGCENRARLIYKTDVTATLLLQISDNVVTHQFNRYVVSKGKDPYSLTSLEKDALMADMKNDLYPGSF